MCVCVCSLVYCFYLSPNVLRTYFFPFSFSHSIYYSTTTHLLAKSTALMDATALTPKIQHLFNRENLALAIRIWQRFKQMEYHENVKQNTHTHTQCARIQFSRDKNTSHRMLIESFFRSFASRDVNKISI